ncbi:hypothetical protein [Amphibiibacter pelophylacis]|uniref:Uncharacterized protein n=1 Tax=Amphibiibacter pelophylacis TaxID=1799477 RepID=A0ACC6NY16_9BURK
MRLIPTFSRYALHRAVLATVLAGVTALPALAQAATAAEDAAQAKAWQHTAQCAAVMKREAVAQATRYKAGETALMPGMVTLAEDSFALLGTAYKQGLRKAEADRLLAAAEAELPGISADTQRQTLAACRSEGRALFKDANFVERALVSNRARARVEKLVQP